MRLWDVHTFLCAYHSFITVPCGVSSHAGGRNFFKFDVAHIYTHCRLPRAHCIPRAPFFLQQPRDISGCSVDARSSVAFVGPPQAWWAGGGRGVCVGGDVLVQQGFACAVAG